MARRTLTVILIAVISGSFTVGCECNRQQCPGFYANISGADWREAMRRCSNSCDDASGSWCCRVRNELSGFDSNISGADWRDNVAGSCCCPASANRTAPAR
jgi:hypothetical protein